MFEAMLKHLLMSDEKTKRMALFFGTFCVTENSTWTYGLLITRNNFGANKTRPTGFRNFGGLNVGQVFRQQRLEPFGMGLGTHTRIDAKIMHSEHQF
ncbi:hypothetical protein Zmor_012855 [Zophobas morio]|uniref:Uncharacterized protein n=1 Tax=Zophobas morio TaxID=2755281 RepID=A0AA38IEB7_9CUCU|nr:hypothetical protein Zmor_012855 [Zophobas morio]